MLTCVIDQTSVRKQAIVLVVLPCLWLTQSTNNWITGCSWSLLSCCRKYCFFFSLSLSASGPEKLWFPKEPEIIKHSVVENGGGSFPKFFLSLISDFYCLFFNFPFLLDLCSTLVTFVFFLKLLCEWTSESTVASFFKTFWKLWQFTIGF